MDVKLGQQSIDHEFMTSVGSASLPQHGDGLADDAFGRPVCRRSGLSVIVARRAAACPALATISRCSPACSRTTRPAASFFNDSQLLGSTRWGGNFNLRTGALFIAEAQ